MNLPKAFGELKTPLLWETFMLVHGALRRMDGNLPLFQSLLLTILYRPDILLDNSKITISKLIVYHQVAECARHFFVSSSPALIDDFYEAIEFTAKMC